MTGVQGESRASRIHWIFGIARLEPRGERVGSPVRAARGPAGGFRRLLDSITPSPVSADRSTARSTASRTCAIVNHDNSLLLIYESRRDRNPSSRP